MGWRVMTAFTPFFLCQCSPGPREEIEDFLERLVAELARHSAADLYRRR